MKFDSLVRKRCRHPQSEWALCACAWYYHVTYGTYTTKDGKTSPKKHRGKIPDATSYEDAKRVYQLIAARIRNDQAPVDAAPAISGLTLAQLGEDWLSVPRDRKPSGIASHRGNLRTHIVPELGDIQVTALTHEDGDRWVRIMAAKTVSTATKVSAAITLSALLTFAVKKKRLRADNPVSGLASDLRDPNAPIDQGLGTDDYFTADEEEHLLTTCREHFSDWYPFVLTGLRTGLRLGEILGLKWTAINWRRSMIRVTEAWVKDAWTTPKNRRARDVEMSRGLRAVLYLRWRRHRRSELVFPSQKGTPLQHTNVRRRLWTPLLEKAELHHRKIHAMRHTFATRHLQKGGSLFWVQKQLGHRSVDITMNVYGHFAPSDQRCEADRLDADTVSGSRARTATKAGSSVRRRLEVLPKPA